MKKNMGTADRTIRVAVALVMGGLIAMGKISGVLAIILASSPLFSWSRE